jgi:DNA-binding GntR family transcriptional regulator
VPFDKDEKNDTIRILLEYHVYSKRFLTLRQEKPCNVDWVFISQFMFPSKSEAVKKVDPQLRMQAIYKEIRDRICLLKYPPGMALKEKELADEFGVSRTPIRGILQRLEFEGLVSGEFGGNSIVTFVDIRSLKQVYALRLRLAEIVGELSSQRVPADRITALASLLEEFETMRDQFDPVQLARLYNRFHEEMLELIGNQPLRQISDQLFHQTARVWLQILPELDWKEEVNYICEELKDVIDALQHNDMQRMALVRRDHMSMLLHRINDYLGDADLQ